MANINLGNITVKVTVKIVPKLVKGVCRATKQGTHVAMLYPNGLCRLHGGAMWGKK